MAEKTIKYLVKSGHALPIWTAGDAVYADKFSIDLGVNAKLLMENAGKAVADAVLDIAKKVAEKPRILVFVGPGNNGADAVVAARHLLAHGLPISLFLVQEQESKNAELQYQIALIEEACAKLGGENALINKIDGQENFVIKHKPSLTIIVDGIFGAGLKRAPSGLMHSAIAAINDYKETHGSQCAVVSVDVPSGLTLEACVPMGVCIKADKTITFGHLKRVHISEPTKAFCGQCESKNIGLFSDRPATNFWLARRKAPLGLFLPVKKSAHKGNFGHVLVLEGHDNFVGASRMSALAALRVGAGLVTIATQTPSQILPIDHAEFMHRPVETLSDEFLRKIDSLVIGPGLSQEDAYQERALHLLNRLKHPVRLVVLDADGLGLLHNKSLRLKNTCIIATPHSKEAARLLGCDVSEVERDRFFAIEELAKIQPGQENQVIWVLKGATTLVREHGGTIFALRGDLPVLASGGSGDVLSGTIAGLAKQTPCPLSAALLAASLHIEAGKTLSKSIFKGSLASELADILPVLTKDRPVID